MVKTCALQSSSLVHCSGLEPEGGELTNPDAAALHTTTDRLVGRHVAFAVQLGQ
jgi:hypothetical protein